MTWQPERYPENWDELARECKERAGWKCEECGIAHGTELIGRKRGRLYKVRLAAAHLDHDPENPEPRLRALCERCHLLYDEEIHKMNAAKNGFQKEIQRGQLVLDSCFIQWPERSIKQRNLFGGEL